MGHISINRSPLPGLRMEGDIPTALPRLRELWNPRQLLRRWPRGLIKQVWWNCASSPRPSPPEEEREKNQWATFL